MPKNALVIMFDSLSYRYVGAYGNTWIKTPNMDRLAREGVLFEEMYIEGLPTIPCRRAMLTGRYTLAGKGWSPLEMDDTSIADLCWGRPIDTAMIYDCPMYQLPKFGYTRGYDKAWFIHGQLPDQFYAHDPLYHRDPHEFMEDHIPAKAKAVHGTEGVADFALQEAREMLGERQYWRTEYERPVHKTVRKAIEYLEQVDRNKQFFLWVDSFDPHEPWDPPSVYTKTPCPYDPEYKGKNIPTPIMGPAAVYTEPELNHIRMLYAELITVCDNALGILMDAVRRLGFEQDTLFMMVSDHGEPMGNAEHGHGILATCRPWPYDELSHAPMLLRAPGIKAGQRIKAFVQSCDIAPTICDWLGIGVHPDMTGQSLLPLCRGEVSKVRDFAISGYYKASWAIYTQDWCFIHWLSQDKVFVENEDANNIDHLKKMDKLEVTGTAAMMTGLISVNPLNAADTAQDDLSPSYQERIGLKEGEEQWTCGGNAKMEVPEADELYNRKTDPYQLNNVANQHPDICKELYATLRTFMADLKEK